MANTINRLRQTLSLSRAPSDSPSHRLRSIRMRVFVLSPGRSGSVTFAEACKHMTNFTTAHESRAADIGARRFEYADQHIEVDNRLTWMLGGLAAHEKPGDRYVWLRRDLKDVAASFLRRWTGTRRTGIIQAFAHAIIMQPDEWPEETRTDVARFYVESVEANIAEFVKDRNHVTTWLGSQDDFAEFWQWIGAEGDLTAALSTWATPHNLSTG